MVAMDFEEKDARFEGRFMPAGRKPAGGFSRQEAGNRIFRRALAKVNGLWRRSLICTLSGALPLYVVTEYPRSGGTWLGQLISGCLQLPFPRNRIPKLQSSIIHGHYKYCPTMRNVCVMFRDGRDVTVSYYFHSLFRNEISNADLVKHTRSRLRFDDYENIEANLPRFIEYLFEGNRFPSFTWSDFVRNWAGRKAVQVRYECLLEDTPGELGRILESLTGKPWARERLLQTCRRFAFSRQTGRQPGEEDRNAFLRKGVSGDWKSYFNKEARQRFNYHAGSELRLLGYEKDDSWVQQPSKAKSEVQA